MWAWVLFSINVESCGGFVWRRSALHGLACGCYDRMAKAEGRSLMGWGVSAGKRRSGQHGWMHGFVVSWREVIVDGGQVGWPRWGFVLISAAIGDEHICSVVVGTLRWMTGYGGMG